MFSTMKTQSVYMENKGFTLVELMISLLISGLTMATVISVFTAQTRRYATHDDIAGIQQNLRGALTVLTLEIRTAGCDPTEKAKAKIETATKAKFQFTRDIGCNNGATGNTCDDSKKPYLANGKIDTKGVDEDITYTLTGDSNNDGIVDNGGTNWSGTASLGRQVGNSIIAQPLADNIEALEFSYLLKGDNTPTLNPSTLQRNDIRAVQVSMLARASAPAENYLHTATYTTGSGAIWTPPQDHFRRRMIITTIQCRNIGL
ncbi:MAG: PilW family protein [Desulfobulbus sp.]|nr:PilW family protein [Desulfobulbus sp.]